MQITLNLNGTSDHLGLSGTRKGLRWLPVRCVPAMPDRIIAGLKP